MRVIALLLLCAARIASAQIGCPPGSSGAPPLLAVSINGSADAQAFLGVGAYFALGLVPSAEIPPAAGGVAPLSLADAGGTWSAAARIEIRSVSSGALQTWPLAPLPGASGTLALEPGESTELLWTLSPQATASLPPGEYRVTGVIEPHAPLPAGAWCGSAHSAEARLRLTPAPALSTPELRERRYLVQAEYDALRGDFAAAEAAVDTLLALDPQNAGGRVIKADLAARRGLTEQAAGQAAFAVRAAAEALPGADELPRDALKLEAALLARRVGESGSLGAAALTVRVGASGSTATPGISFVDLIVENSGNAHAIDARLETLGARVLGGSGAVAPAPGLNPDLPRRLGDLAPGASVTTRIFVSADPGVSRFALSERGSHRDVAGQQLRFSASQGVTR